MHRPLAALAAILATLATAGCGGNQWTSAQVQQFVDGCKAGGSPETFCYCVLDDLQARYTAEQVTNADSATTQAIMRVYADCSS